MTLTDRVPAFYVGGGRRRRMDSTRRRTLRTTATGLAALFAGCAGLGGGGTPTPSPSPTPTATPADRDGDGVPDSDDEYPGDDRRSRRVAGRELSLEIARGTYNGFGITFDERGVLSYRLTVQEGPNVDVLVIPRDDLETFRNNQSVRFVQSLTRWNTASANVNAVIDAGEYALVVDNSYRGRSQPGDEEPTTATADFRFVQAV